MTQFTWTFLAVHFSTIGIVTQTVPLVFPAQKNLYVPFLYSFLLIYTSLHPNSWRQFWSLRSTDLFLEPLSHCIRHWVWKSAFVPESWAKYPAKRFHSDTFKHFATIFWNFFPIQNTFYCINLHNIYLVLLKTFW